MHVITTQTEPISFPFFFHEGREGGTVGKRKEGREGGWVVCPNCYQRIKKIRSSWSWGNNKRFFFIMNSLFLFSSESLLFGPVVTTTGVRRVIMCLTDRGPVRRSVYNMFFFIIDRYQSRHSWGTASETIEQIWRVLGDHHNDRCVPEDDSKRYQEKLLRVSTTMGSWKCGIAS